MPSKLFGLDIRDFTHGLIVAVLTGVCTAAYSALEQQSWPDWKTVGLAAAAAALAYIMKQLGTNSQGNFMAPEPPPMQRRVTDQSKG